jgi:hypothetical protein
MMGRIRIAALLLSACAGCYAPDPGVGAPCGPNMECPSGQVCDVKAPGGPTCVISPSTPDPDAGIEPDASTTGPDAAPQPVTADTAANAVDVGAGGSFMWTPGDLADDYTSSCSTGAGVDVFFKISLAVPEVIYLDTFGSSSDTSISVRAGDCTPIGAAEQCVDDSCGMTQSQGAWNLPAGDHCIIVDQVGAGGAMGRLQVTRGTRGGDPLVGAAGTVSGDTCMDDNSNSASCGDEPAEDHHYFVAVCPGMHPLRIDTCGKATWDTVLQIRSTGSGSTNLECEDDDCDVQTDITETLNGPGLFWAIIDGYDDCGPYMMAFSLD